MCCCQCECEELYKQEKRSCWKSAELISIDNTHTLQSKCQGGEKLKQYLWYLWCEKILFSPHAREQSDRRELTASTSSDNKFALGALAL